MGLYCEPKEDKASWILANGEPISRREALEQPINRNYLPVAMLQQGFIALAIGYNKKEIQRLANGRPDATWFIVSKEKLLENTPGGEHIEELK